MRGIIAHWERQYLATLSKLVDKCKDGDLRNNRTIVQTASMFGCELKVPIGKELPFLLSKNVHVGSVTAELLWFLRGETNISWLKENGCSIWDQWADEKGELGPVYGAQWRGWRGANKGVVDQIDRMIDTLRKNPDSRRNIVSAWNVDVLPDERLSPQENVAKGKQALAPCHMLFQVHVERMGVDQRLDHAVGILPDELVRHLPYGEMRATAHDVMDRYNVPSHALNMRVDQRSADWFLGVPFNIASYALLTHLLCTQVSASMVPGELTMHFGDYHLYANQLGAAEEQLLRAKALTGVLDTEERAHWKDIDYPVFSNRAELNGRQLHKLELGDIQLDGYVSCGRIIAPKAAV